MDRKLFLRNALMSIAVSLLPEILRPVENLFEAGESPVPDEFSVTYDPKKSYLVYHNGGEFWHSGAALNAMNEWEYERRKGLYDHWKKFL